VAFGSSALAADGMVSVVVAAPSLAAVAASPVDCAGDGVIMALAASKAATMTEGKIARPWALICAA
jgi:hypothetical protein